MKKRKKKTVKRTIAWGLAAVMCMGIVPSNMVSTYAQSSSVAAAQEEVAESSSEIKESGNFQYRIFDNDTVEIVKYTGEVKYLIIPDALDGKAVVSIGAKAFQGNTTLGEVRGGSNVKVIKESAFAGCSNLSIIDICYVKEIYDNAFYNCTSLEDVEMSSVEKFGKQAFYGCKNLPEVSLRHTKEIGEKAFYGCESITEMTGLDETIEVMGDKAFGYTENDKKIANAVIEINGKDDNVVVENYAKTNGIKYTYLYDYKETEDGVAEITKYNGNKVTAYIPKKLGGKLVIFIGEGAFQDNTDITEVKFDTTSSTEMREIKDKAFLGCSNLTEVKGFEGEKIGAKVFFGCEKLRSVDDLEGVKEIGESAFEGCKKMRYFDFPSAIEIGKRAFFGCSKMAKFYFWVLVQKIGEQALGYYEEDGEVKVNKELVIKGDVDTAAEEYAQNNDFVFEKNEYTVTFKDAGEIIEKQKVLSGEDAVLPNISKEGYRLVWEGNYTYVRANSVVKADWVESSWSIPEVSGTTAGVPNVTTQEAAGTTSGAPNASTQEAAGTTAGAPNVTTQEVTGTTAGVPNTTTQEATGTTAGVPNIPSVKPDTTTAGTPSINPSTTTAGTPNVPSVKPDTTTAGTPSINPSTTTAGVPNVPSVKPDTTTAGTPSINPSTTTAGVPNVPSVKPDTTTAGTPSINPSATTSETPSVPDSNSGTTPDKADTTSQVSSATTAVENATTENADVETTEESDTTTAGVPTMSGSENTTQNVAATTAVTSAATVTTEVQATTQANKKAATKGIELQKAFTGKKGQIIKDTTFSYCLKADKTFEIIAFHMENTSKVVIPDTITVKHKKYKVTSIKSKVFAGKRNIQKVVIGKNIKTIGKQSFSGCLKVTTITFKGNKVPAIKKEAFVNISQKAIFTVPKKAAKQYKAALTRKTGYQKDMKIKKK